MTRTSSVLITFLLFVTATAFAQTGTIRGRVTDETAVGVIGARVVVLSEQRAASVADVHGDFTIEDLSPGCDTLRVTSPGYRSVRFLVNVKADTISTVKVKPLELGEWREDDERFNRRHSGDILIKHPKVTYSARVGTIKGRVISNKTKKPIQGAWIDSPRMREQTTNGNGEFRLSGMPVGLDTLLVGAEEHSSLRVPVSVVPDSQTTVNVELKYGGFTLKVSMACSPGKPCIYHEPFTIKPGKFTLAGLVRENEGDNRVPYAIVTTYFSYTDSDDVTRQDCCASVVADSMGRFVFQNLYPGEYDLSARRSRDAVDQDLTSLSTIADSLYRLDFHLGEKTK